MIMGQNERPEEREFYLRLAVKAKWSKRELARQIKTAAFERTVLSDKKLAALPRLLPQDATGVFKDSYQLDFLDLPQRHSEADLQISLLRNLRKFLMELGDGFAFVGEKVRVQVGNQDFELDLLFYHRALRCLVAFELNPRPQSGDLRCPTREPSWSKLQSGCSGNSASWTLWRLGGLILEGRTLNRFDWIGSLRCARWTCRASTPKS